MSTEINYYDRCINCAFGELHGFPPKTDPRWEVGTVYFWCPIKEHHDQHMEVCDKFKNGKTKLFDKYGRVWGDES